MTDEVSEGALHDLRLADLVTFLNVARTGSVTSAAREMKTTPSQASKALARLEQHYRVKLLRRGPKAMTLTDEGRQIMPHITDAVKALATAQITRGEDVSVELTFAGPSYALGIIVAAVAAAQPAVRLRGIELAPSQLRANVTEGLFDIALSPGGLHGLPPTWVSDDLGVIRKVLVGPPGLVSALSSMPATVDQVRALPFVGALSAMGGRLAPRADDCPLPVAERTIVHRVQTFGAALELAVRANCVAFGPWIAARRLLLSGELVEIPVIGWNETESIQLVCNGDVVRDRMRKQLITTIRLELTEFAKS